MNENPSSALAEPTGGAATEPARMSPLSRFFNVFLSPGAVFEDIRRNPRGWWVPIVIGVVLYSIFASLYVSRYDISLVTREQLKDHWSMKLAGMAGPEAKEKALEGAVQAVESTPPWQMVVSQWVNIAFYWVVVVWFFAFLYALMALMMGWLGEVRASKLWINFGIVLGILVLSFVATSIVHVAGRGAAGGGMAEEGQPPPQTPAWVAIGTIVIGLAAIGLILWSLFRLARQVPFGRVIGAVSYGMAPGAILALVGIVIVFLRTPDATPLEELVPADLKSLLGLGGDGGAGQAILASLGASLGIFSIWSLVLTIIGLAKGLGRTMGQAAAIVLIPWGAVLLLKIVFAAAFA